MRTGVFTGSLALVLTGAALGGARIDLRPTPPMPPGGYAPNTLVRVDVYFVDTGNPEGDITFAHISLDLTDTLAQPGLSMTELENVICCGCSSYVRWDLEPCATDCPSCPQLVRPFWLAFVPGSAFVMPDGGEVFLGYLEVNVGSAGGLFDVVNADDPALFEGAYTHLESHHPGDPEVMWRAYTGELTGGQLELMVNTGAPLQIVASDPPNDAIDARQPTDVSGEGPLGWQQVHLTFNGSLCEPFVWDFVASEEGGDGVPPFVVAVDYLSAQEVDVYLSEPIEPGAWTTITHLLSGASMRIGYLPGDVNGDGTSSPADILALIDALNGLGSFPLYSTDTNRSGVAEPSDVLRLIDLLNGAGEFEVWNGISLP